MAYHHFSNDESVIDLVAQDKDVIVLRTFSKIYGMAGLRAGFAFARPEKFWTVAAPAFPQKHIDHERRAPRRDCWTKIWCRCGKDQCGYSIGNEFLTARLQIVPGSQGNMFMVDGSAPGRVPSRHVEGERGHDRTGQQCRTMSASRLEQRPR
jgi:histidinol-phosphate aminotransferase